MSPGTYIVTVTRVGGTLKVLNINRNNVLTTFSINFAGYGNAEMMVMWLCAIAYIYLNLAPQY